MATTTIFSVATQGAWWIPAETVCSFQAATLPTLSAILSGDGFDEETKRVAVSSTSLTLQFAANEQLICQVSLVDVFRFCSGH